MVYSALPALDIGPAFDPYKAAEEEQQYETDQQMLPYARQSALDKYSLAHTDYGNNMMSQAATSALTADPDNAPQIWDQQMSKLAQSGVPGAAQYIGHYRPDLAQRVQSVFGGGTSEGKTTAQQTGQQPQLSAQQMLAVQQMPADQREQSLKNMNMAINGFNNVKDAASWQAELDALKQAGIPVDKFLGSTEYNPMNYRAAYQAIQKLVPFRDAIQGAQTNAAFGIPAVTEAQPVTWHKPGEVGVNAAGQVVTTIPGGESQEKFKLTKTANGGDIIEGDHGTLIDPRTNQVIRQGTLGAPAGVGTPTPAPAANTQMQMQQAYAPIVDKFIQSESNGNPLAQNANSTSSGITGAINPTYIKAVRSSVPGAANMTDAQIIAMKTDPKFDGFNRDIMSQILQDGGNDLARNGLPVTSMTVGMVGKIGLPAAQKVLNARDPNTPMSAILGPDASKANPQWAKMNVTQFAASMMKQFGNNPMQASGQEQPESAADRLFGNTAGSDLQDANPDAKEILGQTGLSLPGFMMLTGQGAQLPRASQDRRIAQKTAEDFAKTRGVDLSTFSHQYKALNTVLDNNVQRYNNTRVMEDELKGTIQNLKPTADQVSISNLTPANVAAIFAGQKTNGPISNEYIFYLTQLRSELAGYNAALRGKKSGEIDDRDMNEAANQIINGVNSVGISGIERAITNSTDKMGLVMQKNIDRTRKDVWDLFGVGKNYKPLYPAAANFGTPGGGGRQLSAQDQQAISWANANPKDPRAVQIKARLGM